MPNIHIREIPQEVYNGIKAAAHEAGRSVSAQIRSILADSVSFRRSPVEIAREIEEIRANYSPEKGSRRDLDRFLNEDRDR